MKRKIVLLLVSCLMAVSLILASCAPAVVEEEEKPPVVEEKKPVVEEKPVVPEKEMVRDAFGNLVQKPEYGGTLTYIHYKSPTVWDSIFTSFQFRLKLVNEHLLMGDVTKGPRGTKEVSWAEYSYVPPEHQLTGVLAESWEWSDPTTVVYHIRKGVHWQNKPPVNGRELNADDVVHSLDRAFFTEPKSVVPAIAGKVLPTSIKALDRYTVEVKSPDPLTAVTHFEIISQAIAITAPEVIEKYGNQLEWKNVVGTGPFILIDEVGGGSATTFERNPHFWEKDPFFPENQLPYMDKVRWLIIKDSSTYLAAFRTGKCDWLRTIRWEDAEQMIRTNPETQYYKDLEYSYAMHLRVDKPEQPWYDKRVRYALSMAIDRETLIEDYWGGNADMYTMPVSPRLECKEFFTPFEELPRHIQELYEYNPDKARQLLVEAGYPDGFKLKVLVRGGRPDVDLLTMIMDMYADIGVELEIDLRESGVFISAMGALEYEDSVFYGRNSYSLPIDFAYYHVGPASYTDLSRPNDSKVIENSTKIREAYVAGDWDEQCRLVKEITPYILEQAWVVAPPCPILYELWQPWLHNVSGEYAMGRKHYHGHIKYLWVDKELKKEMGY